MSRRFPYLLPVLVFVFGTMAAVAVALWFDRSARQRDAERFDFLVESRLAAIADRMDTYVALLRAGAGLFTASDTVTGEEFRRFVDRLDLETRYRGVQGLGFARVVGPGERAAVEEMGRQGDKPDFAVWPPPVDSFVTTILFLEPHDARNLAALGFDMYSEPNRRAAMARARDTGRESATARVELIQEIAGLKQPGFLIYLPVYQEEIPASPEARREALRGWIYMPFRAGDLFTAHFDPGRRGPEIEFAVYDGDMIQPEALLYASLPVVAPSSNRGLETVRRLAVAGRSWTIHVATAPAFTEGSTRVLFPWVLAAGLISTALLSGATLAQARAVIRARDAQEDLRQLNATLETRVERRTIQLERARARLAGINANLERIVSNRTADLTLANEEIQRFAYIVSHDLRAPLVNVMGFTSELESVRTQAQRLLDKVDAEAAGLADTEIRTALREDLPEAIGFIRSSTARMDRLINAILRLSREGRRVLTPERLDLAEIVTSARNSLAHRLDAAGASLAVEGNATVESDRLAVEQVVGNLLENAVKYLDPARPGRIVVRIDKISAGVRLAVEDNGRGIDPRDFERIFDLFRRAGPQDQPGEGIGLAHVRALVRRLGGTIGVDSRLGQGSTFTLTLPKSLKINDEEASA